VDKLTGEVLPVIVDAHNHCWDAVRYSHFSMIKGGVFSDLELEDYPE
jgi:phage terminase large subunit